MHIRSLIYSCVVLTCSHIVLNEKINRLEKTVIHCEACAKTTAYDPQDEEEILLNNKDDFSESHTTLSE
jgi:hypothetical protein